MTGFCAYCGVAQVEHSGRRCFCAGRVGDQELLTTLLTAAENGDRLRELEYTTDEVAIVPLHLLARHETFEIRKAAIAALANIGSAESWDLVANIIDNVAVPVDDAELERIELLGPDATEDQFSEYCTMLRWAKQPENTMEAVIASHLVRYLANIGEVGRDRLDQLQAPGTTFSSLATGALARLGDARAVSGLARHVEAMAVLVRYPEARGRMTATWQWMGLPMPVIGSHDELAGPYSRLLAAALPELEAIPDDTYEQVQLQAPVAVAAEWLLRTGRRDLVELARSAEAQAGLTVRSRSPKPGVAPPPGDVAVVDAWALDLRVLPPGEKVPDGTRFGGQPSWRDSPTWPLAPEGFPMAFWAQIEDPENPDRMAYLFVDVNEWMPGWDDPNRIALITQPRGHPPTVPYIEVSTGPVVVDTNRNDVEGHQSPSYTFQPRIPTLERFDDPVNREYNYFENPFTIQKVGGSPTYVSEESPQSNPNSRLLFQINVDEELGSSVAPVTILGFLNPNGSTAIAYNAE